MVYGIRISQCNHRAPAHRKIVEHCTPRHREAEHQPWPQRATKRWAWSTAGAAGTCFCSRCRTRANSTRCSGWPACSTPAASPSPCSTPASTPRTRCATRGIASCRSQTARPAPRRAPSRTWSRRPGGVLEGRRRVPGRRRAPAANGRGGRSARPASAGAAHRQRRLLRGLPRVPRVLRERLRPRAKRFVSRSPAILLRCLYCTYQARACEHPSVSWISERALI
jgi:hypothetical protein